MRIKNKKKFLAWSFAFVLLGTIYLYAADDAKVKLTDAAGVSTFAVQNSTPTTVMSVDSLGDIRFKSGTAFDGQFAHAITAGRVWTFPDVSSTVEVTANKNAASGYAPLDAGSMVPLANMPTGTVILLYADEADTAETNTSTAETTLKTWDLPANTYTTIIVEAEVQGRRESDAAAQCVFDWRIKEAGVTKKTFNWRLFSSAGGTAGLPQAQKQSATIKTSFAGGQVAITTLSLTGQMSISLATNGILAHSFRVYGVK